MTETRLTCLQEFYLLLDDLENRLGGKRVLTNSHGRMNWPKRGIYFFFEAGEVRSHSGIGPRVVRVGTHAVSANSSSTLWGRLSAHRGSSSSGGGNHRGSIFRLLLGEALSQQNTASSCATWGEGNSAPKQIREGEISLERSVTHHLSQMPFLWLEADDEPSKESVRGFIERNSIAVLSNFGKDTPIDPPSAKWLGTVSPRMKVRSSGLWNQNYVADKYDPNFLETFAVLVAKQGKGK